MNLLIACVYGAAGCAVFLFLFNRVILHLRDSHFKSYGSAAGMVLSAGLPTVAGYMSGVSPWLALPIAILVVAGLVEGHHLLARWRCRADGPVEVSRPLRSWRCPFTTVDLVTRRYELPCPAWAGRRLRIAHVSDWHLTDRLPEAYYRRVTDTIREAQPDLLLMTGDFVSEERHAAMIGAVLARARGRLGTFAILGNHDFWANADAVRKGMQEAGVCLLGNGWERISVEGKSVVVAGCEHPWSPDAWHPPPATEEPVLLLTHTPDNIYRLGGFAPFAVFAGHLHAGQGRLPLLGAPVVPSRYGRRFVHGHFKVGATHLFVSSGVGASLPPIRIFCHPEITFIDILPGRDPMP